MDRKEQQRLWNKNYRDKHKKELSIKNKIYREKNLDKKRQKDAEYYIKNKDKILQNVKEYGYKKRDIVLENKRKFYKKNKDKLLKYQKQYYKENRYKIINRNKLYYSTEQGAFNKRNNNIIRRKKENLSNDGTITLETIKFMIIRQKNECNGCKNKLIVNGKRKYQIDHIIPISKGGLHTISNIQLLCKDCNLKKSAKLVDDIFFK